MIIISRRPSPRIKSVRAKKSKWRTLAESGDIDSAICSYVGSNGHATIARLVRDLSKYVDSENTRTFTLADPNIILWLSLSNTLAESIRRLVRARRLYIHPTSVLTYLQDGITLPLPVMREVPSRSRRYQQSYWLPVVLAKIPFGDSK